MKILIKNLKGEVFEIECGLDETILETKQKILASKKLEPEIQKLVFKGAVTSNEKTLKEYGLKENDFMVLLTSKKLTNASQNINKSDEEPIVQQKEIVSSKPPIESNIANNGLVFGEALDQTIDNMVSMGFPRNDVIRALHAAYHNPDKALDYLFNGIPDIYIMEQELHTHPIQSPNQVPTQVISRNPDESAIERLCSLGFSREAASSAFYASGRNENYAANILLFNQSNPAENNEEIDEEEDNENSE